MVFLNLERKKTIVAKINEISKKSLSAVIADFSGVSANDINILRKNARQSDVYICVIRNTLLSRAINETQFECFKTMLTGATLIAYSLKEANTSARLLKNFSKLNANLKIKAAVFEKKLILADKIDLLANQLSHNEAIEKLIFIIQEASVGKLVRTFFFIHRKKTF